MEGYSPYHMRITLVLYYLTRLASCRQADNDCTCFFFFNPGKCFEDNLKTLACHVAPTSTPWTFDQIRSSPVSLSLRRSGAWAKQPHAPTSGSETVEYLMSLYVLVSKAVASSFGESSAQLLLGLSDPAHYSTHK